MADSCDAGKVLGCIFRGTISIKKELASSCSENIDLVPRGTHSNFLLVTRFVSRLDVSLDPRHALRVMLDATTRRTRWQWTLALVVW